MSLHSDSNTGTLTLNGFSTRLRPAAIMGILNLTPDSFSDGGRYCSVNAAVDAAWEMIEAGADIIDLGGESTRPGSDPVDTKTELERVIPVLEALPKERVLLSVDSYKPAVQAAALKAGAHIINDITGGSNELYALAGKHQAGLILMHTPAPPKVMQDHTGYADVVAHVREFLEQKVHAAQSYKPGAIWTDPGIGFGKNLPQNLQLMRSLNAFRFEGCGVLLGASRKSWIGHLTGAAVEDRMAGSLVALAAAIQQNVSIIRVHDVAASVQARDVALALLKPENRIIINDISLKTTIGLEAEERLGPQELLVDLDLLTDFADAVANDNAESVTNYTRLIDEVRRFAANRRDHTLEKFACLLADHLRQAFPRLVLATVKVSKPRYTAALNIGGVAVEATR